VNSKNPVREVFCHDYKIDSSRRPENKLQCTMHNAKCTMHNAQCTMHNAQLKANCNIDTEYNIGYDLVNRNILNHDILIIEVI